jgi:hypothetical protein
MRKIVCAVILALLLLALLTLTFSIQAEQAIFYDDFDAGLVQWNNFGYPTPATFQDPSFEDGWGYSTEGDSWHLSGSWSKQLIDISNGIVVEFRVKQGAGNIWDYIAIGIGGARSGYTEEYQPWYFIVAIYGRNPNDNADYTDDIQYSVFFNETSLPTYIEDAANDHEFHIFKMVYNSITNLVDFYKDGNYVVTLQAHCLNSHGEVKLRYKPLL